MFLMTVSFLKNKGKRLVFNSSENHFQQSTSKYQIKPGDTVSVKSKNGIDKTLDCRENTKTVLLSGECMGTVEKLIRFLKKWNIFLTRQNKRCVNAKI